MPLGNSTEGSDDGGGVNSVQGITHCRALVTAREPLANLRPLAGFVDSYPLF